MVVERDLQEGLESVVELGVIVCEVLPVVEKIPEPDLSRVATHRVFGLLKTLDQLEELVDL